MKIVGNIKDYYDGAASQFGYADDVIYNRTKSELIGVKNIPGIAFNLHRCSVTIGFCGKIYYGYYPNNIWPYTDTRIRFPYFEKDVADVLGFYNQEKKRIGKRSWSIGRHLEEIAASCGFIKRDSWMLRQGMGSGYLDSVENHDVFTKLGCPAFVIKHNERLGEDAAYILVKNPILKDYDFGRIVDPYTAVQEIEMYLGRLATNDTPPMPVGSDKVIAESKGFDKYSFRKLPSK